MVFSINFRYEWNQKRIRGCYFITFKRKFVNISLLYFLICVTIQEMLAYRFLDNTLINVSIQRSLQYTQRQNQSKKDQTRQKNWIKKRQSSEKTEKKKKNFIIMKWNLFNGILFALKVTHLLSFNQLYVYYSSNSKIESVVWKILFILPVHQQHHNWHGKSNYFLLVFFS